MHVRTAQVHTRQLHSVRWCVHNAQTHIRELEPRAPACSRPRSGPGPGWYGCAVYAHLLNSQMWKMNCKQYVNCVFGGIVHFKTIRAYTYKMSIFVSVRLCTTQSVLLRPEFSLVRSLTMAKRQRQRQPHTHSEFVRENELYLLCMNVMCKQPNRPNDPPNE